MRRIVLLATAAALVVLGSIPALAEKPDHQRNFTANLKGVNEVGPVETKAQGQAVFHLSKAGDELAFKLIVANIKGATQAHIHCGAADTNGPVVAFLFDFVAEGVDVNGVLSEGALTNSDVIARPSSAECPGGVADFDDLVEKLRSGDAYVNVHTLANAGGEIRGQIG